MFIVVLMERIVNEDYQGFWRDGFIVLDFVYEEVMLNFFWCFMQYIWEWVE